MAHLSFLRAVQHLEVGTIDRLIDEGADIEGVRDSRLYPYIPPLILAAHCGSQRPEVFRLLVERGANPNVVSKETEWYGWCDIGYFRGEEFGDISGEKILGQTAKNPAKASSSSSSAKSNVANDQTCATDSGHAHRLDPL